MRIFDCVTFFQENLVTNLRFEVLKNVVDKFIVCESHYNHRGEKKEINFKLENKKLDKKVKHLILDHPFPNSANDAWKRQAYQREFIFEGLKDAEDNDYIMFSDPDEIPRPEILKNISLNKTYGIFLQSCFNFKINLLNINETPWEGTRIVKKKNLFSFDFMRQKVLKKNINKWWRFNLEKNIQLFKNGGWHFNNLLTANEISIKLKTFAHTEFSSDKFTNTEIIEDKIKNKEDLFNRGNILKKISLDNNFPEEILKKKEFYKEFII